MSDNMVRKQFTATIGKAPGERARRFVISTSSRDRDGDTIAARGWDLTAYRRNPVVLWAHDYRALPIARATSVAVENDRLVATAEFAEASANPLAQQVLSLIDGGFLSATSVGFRPIRHMRRDDGGIDFVEQELLEFSVVPVPANPEALHVLRALTRRAGGDVLHLADAPQQKDRALYEACRSAIEEGVRAKPDVYAPYDFSVDGAARVLATYISGGETIEIEDDPRVEEGIDEDIIRAALAELPGALRADLRDMVQAETTREIRRRLGRVD